MSKDDAKKEDRSLGEILEEITNSNYFKDRFKNAKPLEKPVGWNLPMGSIHRKNHGDGFMLLGDAAGLVDPFTGEGMECDGCSKICCQSREKSTPFRRV